MKTLAAILSALVLSLVSHGGAYAANTKSLFTSPAQGNLQGGAGFQCTLLNVGKNPISATLTVLDEVGSPTASSGPAAVDPGSVVRLTATGSSDFYCQFQVTGSTKTIRASANYFNNVGYSMSIPAQ
jgi:hypothetical protein